MNFRPMTVADLAKYEEEENMTFEERLQRMHERGEMMYPTFLFKLKIRESAKELYVLLLDRALFPNSEDEGGIDEQSDRYCIYPVRELAEALSATEQSITQRLKVLEDVDLIERKRRGLGEPNLIYPKFPVENEE